MGKRGLQYVITDSWEAGVANWTDDMIAEFAKRRGYDMKPWLPALTGRVVESAEATDRFLWDFRKTLDRPDRGVPLRPADRPARGARHGALHRVARVGPRLHRRRHGGQGEGRRADERHVDRGSPGRTSDRYDADVRESASVAHIYGQNLVAAESLTAGSGAWSFSPETLKPTADRLLSHGAEPVRDPHLGPPARRTTRSPGSASGPSASGSRGTRPGPSRPSVWTTYLARSCLPAAAGHGSWPTSLYYYGEDSNVTALFSGNPPPIPAGYNFDYVNSDVVMNRLIRLAGRAAHHGDRDELPGPGARPEQPAHAARRAPQDPRPREGGRGRGRAEADRLARACPTMRLSSRPSPISCGAAPTSARARS